MARSALALNCTLTRSVGGPSVEGVCSALEGGTARSSRAEPRRTGRGSIVDILLNCPHCQGTASFRPPRMAGRGGRLLGRCRSCNSVFSLCGGRVSEVELGARLVGVRPAVRAALTRERAI